MRAEGVKEVGGEDVEVEEDGRGGRREERGVGIGARKDWTNRALPAFGGGVRQTANKHNMRAFIGVCIEVFIAGRWKLLKILNVRV